MAGLKELERRLTSVRNTKKITYAMKLVSTAKLSKAQDAVTRSAEYTAALNSLLADLAVEGTTALHPLMEKRLETKRVRLVVVGGSRGLCGGYNSNINRAVDRFMAEQAPRQVSIDALVIGRKPAEYFRRKRYSQHKAYETLPEDAVLWPVEDLSRELQTAFLSGDVDEVFIIYTRFKSAISQTVMCERLLPLECGNPAESDSSDLTSQGLTLFEPSVAEVFAAVIPRIVSSKFRQACLDAKASEHGSRMAAMEAATKNAGELIEKINLQYNQLRQSSITSEILDLIGGAEAVNN